MPWPPSWVRGFPQKVGFDDPMIPLMSPVNLRSLLNWRVAAKTELALLLTLLLLAPVHADECPVVGAEATLEAIKSAGTCLVAAATYKSCTWGSSMDVQFGQPVVEKCEGEFKAKLSNAHRDAYRREQDRCRRKYANKTGILYLSFAMSCAVNVAESFARRFRPALNDCGLYEIDPLIASELAWCNNDGHCEDRGVVAMAAAFSSVRPLSN
jgi:hypothetical protein